MKLFICLTAIIATTTTASPEEDTKALKVFSDANLQFTANFSSAAYKEKPNKSIVFSAYSLAVPLSELALASVGKTQTQILNALAFPSTDTIKSIYPEVDDNLTTIKGVTFKKANRIYIREQAKLNPEFEKTVKNLFHTEVKKVDFSKSAAVASEINQWVEDQTNNRIKDLISPNALDAYIRAILVNAIYFKGSWKTQFSPKKTKEADFVDGKGNTRKVSMMNIEDKFEYAYISDLDAQILVLPYEGEEAAFVAVLPAQNDGLAALEEKLKNPNALSNALKQTRKQKVNVFLPKFKIESTWDLTKLLSDIGITRVFTPGQADLKNLLVEDEDLYVNSAVQKAFIEVNEEGAEAAAANVIGLGLSPSPPTVLFFIANHPFAFYLVQRNPLVILFNGIFS